MRIVYFNYEWDRRGSTGAATHVSELSKGLRKLGHRVAVHDRHLAPAHGDRSNGRAPAARSSTGTVARRYLHETAALGRALQGMSTETEILQRERPDVVLTRYSLHQFSSLVAARRCGVPIVFEVNAPVAYEYRRFKPQYSLMPGLPEWSEEATLSRADAVFVVSSQLKRQLEERGVPDSSVHVIPNGVDVDKFRPDAADPAVRDKLGKERVIAGFVGSFSRFHGIAALEQAIAKLGAEREDLAFLMVGHSPLAEGLAAECSRLGLADRVLFPGYVTPEEVPGWMSAADILIAPYPAQDFFYMSPIKIFEYMASGRAIAAAAVGQIAELIEDGKTGILYDPRDPRQLAEKLSMLADDAALRESLGQAARRKAVEGYTWEHNARRVEALLESVRADYSGRTAART